MDSGSANGQPQWWIKYVAQTDAKSRVEQISGQTQINLQIAQIPFTLAQGAVATTVISRTEEGKAVEMTPAEKKRAARKADYEANKEKIRHQSKLWYEAHKDRKKETQEAWNEANQARMEEYRQQWFQQNKERIREKLANLPIEVQERRKEKQREYSRQAYQRKRDEILARTKQYNKRHKAKLQVYQARWRQEKKSHINQRRKRHYHNVVKPREKARLATSEYIKVSDAAAMLNVPIRAFRAWVYEGRIESIQSPTGRYLLRREKVEAIRAELQGGEKKLISIWNQKGTKNERAKDN